MEFDPNWRGILKILEIQHLDVKKNVIWEAKNLRNTLHKEGEAFLLNAVFAGGRTSNLFIPNNYYFGLDNRSSISANDTMSTIANGSFEPSTGGYSRQAIASISAFTVALTNLGPGSYYQATGPIITFTASGSSWGPVKNLFLTTAINNGGSLLCSVALAEAITVNSGQSISMRMGISLRDDPF